MSVTRRRIEAAIGTLGDLTGEDHEQLDGATRDAFALVIHVLDEISDQKAPKRGGQ